MTDDALIERMARAMFVENQRNIAEERRLPWDDVASPMQDDWLSTARAALAAIRETHAVIPKEPTATMLTEAAARSNTSPSTSLMVWQAMIAAVGKET